MMYLLENGFSKEFGFVFALKSRNVTSVSQKTKLLTRLEIHTGAFSKTSTQNSNHNLKLFFNRKIYYNRTSSMFITQYVDLLH